MSVCKYNIDTNDKISNINMMYNIDILYAGAMKFCAPMQKIFGREGDSTAGFSLMMIASGRETGTPDRVILVGLW